MSMRVMATTLLAGAMVVLAPLPRSALAQMGPSAAVEDRTADTASYRIKIRTGPTVTMPMSSMTVSDQGNPVNRHLEVYIFNRRTGAEVKDILPVVRVTNQATGASRQLANIAACRISKHRETEPHWGDNISLPDGTYTITVAVAKETAVFRNVALKAAQ